MGMPAESRLQASMGNRVASVVDLLRLCQFTLQTQKQLTAHQDESSTAKATTTRVIAISEGVFASITRVVVTMVHSFNNQGISDKELSCSHGES